VNSLIIKSFEKQRNGGEEMRKYFVCLIGLVMVLGLVGMSSAAIEIDPTGDKIGTGPTDITAARAEQFNRPDGIVVMKVSYTATPNVGGIVIFEADVDDSTGTGGSLSMLGIPVPPLDTQGKIRPGIDVAILMMNRDQAASSASAMCQNCTNSASASCARKRYYGEWYAVAIGTGTSETTGFLRGFADPTSFITSSTARSFTVPWDVTLLRARDELTNPLEKYTYADAINPATTKWQLSVWTDPTYADGDDFGDGTTFFNVSDYIPNAGLISSVDAGTNLTFCEGNFDGDRDQDGTDASRYKSDAGRSPLLNPCPQANYYY
jgi:hypothetical protein